MAKFLSAIADEKARDGAGDQAVETQWPLHSGQTDAGIAPIGLGLVAYVFISQRDVARLIMAGSILIAALENEGQLIALMGMIGQSHALPDAQEFQALAPVYAGHGKFLNARPNSAPGQRLERGSHEVAQRIRNISRPRLHNGPDHPDGGRAQRPQFRHGSQARRGLFLQKDAANLFNIRPKGLAGRAHRQMGFQEQFDAVAGGSGSKVDQILVGRVVLHGWGGGKLAVLGAIRSRQWNGSPEIGGKFPNLKAPAGLDSVPHPLFHKGKNVAPDILSLIGNTPLVKLRRASQETGCTILGKCEFMNPGQSVKDRAALYIIRDAERRGALRPGGTIVEGTAGNTGIGLAMVANALGYKTVIVIPETQSAEKKDTLRLMGARLVEVPAVPYKDPNNYVKWSGRLAEELNASEKNGAIWANQFDNVANRQAHIETTGPEIWNQTDGKVDGFTCAIGSGGTLAGVAMALKARNPKIRTAVADPMGAAMYSFIKTGELKSEGSSITEGIGQGRVTANIKDAPIDDAFQIPDSEAVSIVFDLLEHEGLCLGGSSGINVAGAMAMAREMGPGHTIVTILCDYGTRYQSKLFNPAFLRSKSLPVPKWLDGGVA